MVVKDVIYNAKTGKETIIERELTSEEISKIKNSNDVHIAIKRISELKNLLKEEDFQTIKYVQGKLSQEKFNAVVDQCDEWRKEINYLEEKYNIK